MLDLIARYIEIKKLFLLIMFVEIFSLEINTSFGGLDLKTTFFFLFWSWTQCNFFSFLGLELKTTLFVLSSRPAFSFWSRTRDVSFLFWYWTQDNHFSWSQRRHVSCSIFDVNINLPDFLYNKVISSIFFGTSIDGAAQSEFVDSTNLSRFRSSTFFSWLLKTYAAVCTSEWHSILF